MTAGFCCQPWSIAGKRLGFDDPRSNVFWKIIEIAKYHNPQCIVLENVKNLTTRDNKETFKIVIRSLESIGYTVYHNVINTSVVTSIPQNRERVCLKTSIHPYVGDIDLIFPELEKNHYMIF